MGNRINRQQTTDNRLQTRKGLVWIFFCLWSSVFGLQSAEGAERIVSLNACTDELLLQLAAPNQIAGVTRFDHSPKSAELLIQNPQIKKLHSDIESLIKVQPSVVLVEHFSSSLLIHQLEKQNVPVSMLSVPKNWDELLEVSSLIAGISHHPEKLGAFQKVVKNLRGVGLHSKWTGKRAVFWSAAGHVSGLGTFEDTIISTLGMSNGAQFKGYAFLSLEKLIQLKPDVIMVTQNPKQKDSWSHDTLFHPALKAALPHLEYLQIPEEAASCASEYTIEVLTELLLRPET